MIGLQFNKCHRIRKGLAGCLLVVLLAVMLIISAAARYMTTGRATATFVPTQKSSSLYLFTRRNQEGVGEPLEMANSAMQFLCVSNGESAANFESGEDMTFRIRLYLKATEEINEPFSMILQNGRVAGEWGREIVAKIRKLDEESALAKISGSGWIYTFEDATGKELLFTLSGKECSNQYFVLRTNGGVFNQFEFKIELVRSESEVAQ